MFKISKLACAAVVLGGLAFTGGCANDEITANDVRSNWSPELFSTAHSFEQYQTMQTRAVDTTARQFWEDHARIWFVDEPLRFSRYPIP